jgi:pyrophosphatase PpaX
LTPGCASDLPGRREGDEATAVVFDLDGTLIDSFGLIDASFRHAAASVLDRALSEDEVMARWGEPLPARAAHLGAGRVDELIAAYTAYYDANQDRLCRPFASVPEMLAALAARGVRMGVATSKRRRSTRQAIERCGLARWIGAAISAEDVPAPKPAADPVLAALRCLRVAPARAWMVGDGVFDIEAARRAGVRSVAALWGTREREALLDARPDYVAASPDRVVPLVLSG